jgi:hypothetical protein
VEDPANGQPRTDHLLQLLYFLDKYPYTEVRSFHAEVLKAIEIGTHTWTSNFDSMRQHTLVSPLGNRVPSGQDSTTSNKVCGNYQFGRCPHTADHPGLYGNVTMLHVCKRCYRPSKSLSCCRHAPKDCTNKDAAKDNAK